MESLSASLLSMISIPSPGLLDTRVAVHSVVVWVTRVLLVWRASQVCWERRGWRSAVTVLEVGWQRRVGRQRIVVTKTREVHGVAGGKTKRRREARYVFREVVEHGRVVLAAETSELLQALHVVLIRIVSSGSRMRAREASVAPSSSCWTVA